MTAGTPHPYASKPEDWTKPWVARRRPLHLAGATAVLLLCAASEAQAKACPAPPRDWSFKTDHAFTENINIWKFSVPNANITADNLATAITAQNTAVYHNWVKEPVFLERFHDPNNEAYRATYDFRLRANYRQSTHLPGVNVGAHPAGWSWGVNPGHNTFDLVKFQNEDSSKAAKCGSAGLVLIGYYKWAGLAGVARTAVAINQARHDAAYLTTMVDLTAAHVAWLKLLKAETLAWLKAVYDVDPTADKDTVQMYFHYPTGYKTSTLHMHVRVNWQMGPLEYLRAYTIDEVIHALETEHITTARLIANRWHAAGGLVMEVEDGLDGYLVAGNVPADQAQDGALHATAGLVHGGHPVFRAKHTINGNADTSPFKPIKDTLKGVYVTGTLDVVQRAADGQAANNSIRYDSFTATSDWSAPLHKTTTTLFTPGEVTNLKLGGYHGTVQQVLGCLEPYFDGASNERCVRINGAGNDIERIHPH